MTKAKKIKQLSEKLNVIKTEITLKVSESKKIGREIAGLMCPFKKDDIVSDSYVNYIVDDIYLYLDRKVSIKGRRVRTNGEPYAVESKVLHGYMSLPEKWSLVKRG